MEYDEKGNWSHWMRNQHMAFARTVLTDVIEIMSDISGDVELPF